MSTDIETRIPRYTYESGFTDDMVSRNQYTLNLLLVIALDIFGALDPLEHAFSQRSKVCERQGITFR